ncbi:MAG: hypothetical protein QXY52_03835 [Conexivisphaerales archaeon]
MQSFGLKFMIKTLNVGIASGDDHVHHQGHRRSDDEQATFRVVALNGRNRIGQVEPYICYKPEPEAGKLSGADGALRHLTG